MFKTDRWTDITLVDVRAVLRCDQDDTPAQLAALCRRRSSNSGEAESHVRDLTVDGEMLSAAFTHAFA